MEVCEGSQLMIMDESQIGSCSFQARGEGEWKALLNRLASVSVRQASYEMSFPTTTTTLEAMASLTGELRRHLYAFGVHCQFTPGQRHSFNGYLTVALGATLSGSQTPLITQINHQKLWWSAGSWQTSQSHDLQFANAQPGLFHDGVWFMPVLIFTNHSCHQNLFYFCVICLIICPQYQSTCNMC